jgi:hypothetical protein
MLERPSTFNDLVVDFLADANVGDGLDPQQVRALHS